MPGSGSYRIIHIFVIPLVTHICHSELSVRSTKLEKNVIGLLASLFVHLFTFTHFLFIHLSYHLSTQ